MALRLWCSHTHTHTQSVVVLSPPCVYDSMLVFRELIIATYGLCLLSLLLHLRKGSLEERERERERERQLSWGFGTGYSAHNLCLANTGTL